MANNSLLINSVLIVHTVVRLISLRFKVKSPFCKFIVLTHNKEVKFTNVYLQIQNSYNIISDIVIFFHKSNTIKVILNMKFFIYMLLNPTEFHLVDLNVILLPKFQHVCKQGHLFTFSRTPSDL